MKDSALRELAAMAFTGGPEGEAAGRYAVERLPKRYLKKYLLYLKREMSKRKVTVWSAGEADEATRKTFAEVFEGSEIVFNTEPNLGAGLTVEHGDNLARINVRNIIARAINGIKESL